MVYSTDIICDDLSFVRGQFVIENNILFHTSGHWNLNTCCYTGGTQFLIPNAQLTRTYTEKVLNVMFGRRRSVNQIDT